MAHEPIEAVVFDIGMVLVEWHPERFYDAVIGPERRAELFSACDLHAMNRRIDLGEHSRDVASSHAKRHPDWADEIRLWHERWIEMFEPAIELSALTLRALRRRRVPVYALSNFGADTFETAKARYPVLSEFDKAFISGQLGIMKPDPAIYACLERETDTPPERILFTDDVPANVEAARRRGWRTHLFTGPEGWAARLISEGLLDNGDIPG